MTLKEKLAQAQANVPKVYDAGVFDSGYAVGYTEGVDKGQSLFGIQNEVTGTDLVTLDYVNENEHNVEVKLSSDTVTDFSGVEVICTGKNQFNKQSVVGCDGYGLDENGNILVYGYISQTIKLSDAFPSLIVGQTYIFSAVTDVLLGVNIRPKGQIKFNAPFVVTQEMIDTDIFGIYGGDNATQDNPMVIQDLQCELGTVVTPFEEFNRCDKYTANADGTVEGITSISPTMNIICDGVDISAKYYQNPNEFTCNGDIIFTNHGTMYQRNMVVTTNGNDGWYSMAYRYATEMETFSAPLMRSLWTAPSQVVQGCTGLKSVSLPRIGLLGGLFFDGCTSLTDVLLGSEEYPMTKVSHNVFQNCSALKNLTYVGTINGTLNFQWSSLLTVESAKNIIQCLANYKGTSSDLANTITFHANVLTLLDEEGNVSPNGNTWRDYIFDLGWNLG